MKNKILSLFLIIVTVMSLFSGCVETDDGPKELTSYSASSFAYFDTVSKISGYAESQDAFAEVIDVLFEELGEYHRLFDIYNSYDGINNLYTINQVVNGEHQVVKVDRRIIDMLLYAKEWYEKTDGRMNIAMGSVLSIWHDYRTEGIDNPSSAKLPPMSDLNAALDHTDINNVIIDEENSTVYLADPKMKLDVGAIAKGYAVEMVARLLENRGITGYAINVGGNIRTVGKKGNGDMWLTGIENPTEDYENPYVAYIELSGEAIVTSGSYQRYYIVDGKRYHHIIDPATLMPADKGFMSVSVICNNSADGDGLSTALFCMTIEEGMEFVNSLDGVEALWVANDETVYKSDNFDKFVSKS